MMNKSVGAADVLPGRKNIKFNIFALRDVDYAKMPMSTFSALLPVLNPRV